MKSEIKVFPAKKKCGMVEKPLQRLSIIESDGFRPVFRYIYYVCGCIYVYVYIYRHILMYSWLICKGCNTVYPSLELDYIMNLNSFNS